MYTEQLLGDKKFKIALTKYRVTAQKIIFSLEETTGIKDGLELLKLLETTPQYLQAVKTYKKEFEEAKTRYRGLLVKQLDYFDNLCINHDSIALDKAAYEMIQLFLGKYV